ncbi:MAG: cyclic nucleotide-binding domain-containing protein [Deltaproteobacteria bacterium]|nr:cyclic nucleotide-binding domain-containing protein [Deltaproteobacteria bacterium]
MVPFKELRKIHLMENLTDSMLGRMSPLLQRRLFAAGNAIFRQGDQADFFYMLKAGKLLLEADISENMSVSLGAIKAGFCFGWSALLPGSLYTSTAICAEPCETISIPGKEFLKLMEKDHSLGYRVMQIIVTILKSRLERRTEQLLKVIANHPDLQHLFQEQ